MSETKDGNTRDRNTKDRNSPIPAEEASSAKPWRLPFWTDEPAYAVEKDEPEDADAAAEEQQPEPLRVSPPTAEELEKIRREAYNDGLEQGLVEGRQQGVQAGREEGREEGHKQGYDAGFAEGKDAGNRAGYEEGQKKAAAEGQVVVERLNRIADVLMQGISERDRDLPQVMVNLLSGLARNVLQHELSTSNQAIQRYVEAAMEALPGGEKALRIYISSDDAELIQDVSEQGLDWPPMQVDKHLGCGECRVVSEHSRVEYSASEHMTHALEELAARMLSGADGYPDDDELSLVDVAPESPQPDSLQPESVSADDSATEALAAETDQPQSSESLQQEGPEPEQKERGLTAEPQPPHTQMSEDYDEDPVIPSPPENTEKALKYAFDNRELQTKPEHQSEQAADSSPSPAQDTQTDDPEPPLG